MRDIEKLGIDKKYLKYINQAEELPIEEFDEEILDEEVDKETE